MKPLTYAFLYGIIPTTPSVFVYASNYGVLPDMIASTINASTFIAATLNVALETPAHGQKTDPNFQYGATQEVVALVVIIISLLATVFSMILSQRYQPKESVQTINAHTTNNHDDLSEETDALLSDDGPMQESSVEIEDLISPTSGTRPCGGTGLI